MPSNYLLTVTRIPANMHNDLHRWAWRLERKDRTVGYTDSGETYTKLGAYLTVRYRLWKQYRPIRQKEYHL